MAGHYKRNLQNLYYSICKYSTRKDVDCLIEQLKEIKEAENMAMEMIAQQLKEGE